MSLSSIVPKQETCAALNELLEIESVLVWYCDGQQQVVMLRHDAEVRKVTSAAMFPVRKVEIIPAPTASELGLLVAMMSWRLEDKLGPHGYWATQALGDHGEPHASETEARAQLVLWLAKNRPESLGGLIRKENEANGSESY